MVVDSTPGGVRLTVNGKLITLFRTANGSLSAQDRANRAAERLEGLLAKGLTAKDIEARSRPEGGWGVYAQGGLVMIATQEEADLRKEEPEVTARRWAANLKAALAAAPDKAGTEPEPKAASKPQPKTTGKPAPKQATKPAPAPSNDANVTLGVRIDDVPVPLGETRTVNVRGTAKGAVALKVDGNCVRARVINGGDAIQIQGLNLGKANVRIARGGKETTFTAWVKKWAGVIAETPSAMVTGTVAPADYVKKVAVEKAFDGIRREAGTNVSITGSPDGVKALARGASTIVRVPIAISGANYMERREIASVRVDNVALKPTPARVLLYSNDPESVREYGTLYEGLVEDAGPARMMFHHQNKMGRGFMFEVHLLNPNQTPVDVQIIEADAGPILDTIQVGHRAAQRYMDAAMNDRGYVVTIPPRKTRTIYRLELPSMLTVSGFYGFRILDGGPLVAQVTAAPGATTPEVTDDVLAAAKSEPDTYPFPEMDEDYKYAVGDKWTFIPMGRKAIQARGTNKKLFGNYGVIYNLTVELENPTDEEKTVTVRLAAEAGWTRGVFVFDGKIVEAPQIAPPAEAVLWSVKLAPQEHREVKIQGIPVGGSNYPVSLVVRS